MKEFLKKHIDELEVFCNKNQISVEKVLNSPKSYNKESMFILLYRSNEETNGLLNETPCKILLEIRKSIANTLEFIPKENFKKYLS